MLFYCCADFKDGGPTLEQHWVNAFCLLGRRYAAVTKIKPFVGHRPIVTLGTIRPEDSGAARNAMEFQH